MVFFASRSAGLIGGPAYVASERIRAPAGPIIVGEMPGITGRSP